MPSVLKGPLIVDTSPARFYLRCAETTKTETRMTAHALDEKGGQVNAGILLPCGLVAV